MKRRRQHLSSSTTFTGILIVCLGLLTGCDSISLDFPHDTDTSLSDLNLNNSEASESKFVLKRKPGAQDEYNKVYENNLFNAERKFIESEQEETAVEPTATPQRTAVDLPHVNLVGTLTTSNNKYIAFIKDSKAKDKAKRNKTQKFEVGDWLGDYMLSKIEPDKVTLTKGEELAYLRLKPPANLSRKSNSRSRGGNAKVNPKTGRPAVNDRSSRTNNKGNTRSSTTRKSARSASSRSGDGQTEDEIKRKKIAEAEAEKSSGRLTCGSSQRNRRSSSRSSRGRQSSCGR